MADNITNKALEIAKAFHAKYEELAPSFGYHTRIETREFSLNSNNAQLMLAVCEALLKEGVIK